MKKFTPLLLRRRFCLLILFLFCWCEGKSQSSTDLNWTLMQKKDGISLFYSVGECNPGEKELFIKAENDNSADMLATVVFSLTQGSSLTKVPRITLNIPANQEVVIECQRPPHIDLPQIPVKNESDFNCSVAELSIMNLN